MRLPSLFISHGAPDLVLSDLPVTRFLHQLGDELGDIDTIVIATAHWLTHQPVVSISEMPVTMHDYYWGPDPRLYSLEYPAQGNPEVAMRCLELLEANGLNARLDAERDMDHGVWTALFHLIPNGNIPVVMLSIQPYKDPEYHFSIGKALAPLRDEGVLIIGSGAVTHNISGIRKMGKGQLPETYASKFSEWVREKIESRLLVELFEYQDKAPFASRNHPSPDHFLPIFVTLGAASKEPWCRIHSSWTYSVLAMDIYRFG